ncbi:MAG TPA: flagellar motor switch phosphatase FliY [Syntrophomonadaceae bacterium]|nr:flagellar motor switch phosphatase FliY [Syntrophomonadaceae bacterium]
MNDGILSQEEINALLEGATSSEISDNTSELGSESSSSVISDFDKDALGEIGNISMGTSATTLSTLLKKKVSITTPNVFITNAEQLKSDYPLPYVVVEVEYTEGLSGTNILIIKEEDACIIADLMMGGEGICEEVKLDEIGLSAVGEAMNQMMGSATTSLSSMFNARIAIAPPNLTIMDFGKEHLSLSSDYEDMVSIRFKMEIEGLINSEIMQIIPMEAVKNMISMLMGNTFKESTVESITEEAVSTPQEKPISKPVTEPVMQENDFSVESKDIWPQDSYDNIPSGIKKDEKHTVQPVQFAPLRETDNLEVPQNIGLIMDVPLEVTVVLGKTKKTIKDILDLHQGAIIQLDKMAGEPVDLLVNGKLIAKGEVVVIDESYGIRITTIISPIDRVGKLQ